MGPNAFDESRFTVTDLTILEVIEILCSFRLVLEKKTGKETPDSSRFEFLEKFLANNSASPDAQDNNSGLFKSPEYLQEPCAIPPV